MKVSSAFKEAEDDDGNDCEKGEPPGLSLRGGRASPDRGTPSHSFFACGRPVVLDPSIEFLLNPES